MNHLRSLFLPGQGQGGRKRPSHPEEVYSGRPDCHEGTGNILEEGGWCMGWGGGGGLEEARNNAYINSFQISRVGHAKCLSILYKDFRKLI
jgi:hypothetical protein